MGGRGASSLMSRISSSVFGESGGKGTPIVISKLEDKSLQGIENRLRKLNHEEAYVFDENDKLVAGVTGGTTSVDIPEEWMKIDGATVTHGHPSNRFGFGGTLSFKDASLMAESNWNEMRAAASGKGEYNYIMRRTPRSDGLGLRRQIIRDKTMMKNRLESEFYKSYNEAIKQGKSRKSALLESAQKSTGIIHSYWKNVLPQYGFEYVTPKKEYEYGR